MYKGFYVECCLQKWVPQDGEVHLGRGLEDDMHVVNRICSSLDAAFLHCLLNSDTSLNPTITSKFEFSFVAPLHFLQQ